jgi:hypothetical protein
MVIDTSSSVTRGGSDERVRWAGRILVIFGTGHLTGAFALTVREHADRWLSLELWRLDEGILDMSPAMAAFWLTTGSFAAPLVLLGAVLLWLDRRGMAPPRFVAWPLVAWSALAALLLEPAPWLLITAAGGLLVAAGRSAPDRAVHSPPPKA